MANLIITTDCQRNCKFCFVKHDRGDHLSFDWDNFIIATSFISTAGEKNVNLLGGEPTLHKDFLRMLEYLIDSDFKVQVFTNGMVPEELVLSIKKLIENKAKDDQVYFTIHMVEEKNRTEEENRLQKKFIEILHKYTYPSFTIYDEDINLNFLIDLVNDHDMDKTIKLSLALPVIGGENEHLKLSSYRTIAKKIVELSDKADDIVISFDCGFPLCMFTLEEISKLTKDRKNGVKFACGVPLDIYPDLTAVNCAPLSRMHRSDISRFDTIRDLVDSFETGFMTPHGIYEPKCKGCELFRGVCFGGCKSFYKPDEEKENE